MSAHAYAVACSDGWTGEWRSNERDRAEAHAKTLDGFCSCHGTHVVVDSEWQFA